MKSSFFPFEKLRVKVTFQLAAQLVALLQTFDTLTSAQQQPIAEMQASDASVRGAVVLTVTGATIMSGAQIRASRNPTTLKLVRGGELQLCPLTDLTLTASASGQEQLMALNAGAIETHYRLGSSADVLMTPDFRLQLAGPGDFHLAVRVEPRGDVCVESLPGNNSTVIVQELMGEGSHPVAAGDKLIFKNGLTSQVSYATSGCGCPPAPATQHSATELGFPEQQSRRAAEAIASGKPLPEAPVLPGVATAEPGQVQMQVTAPMVFRGEAAPPAPPLPSLQPRADLLPASFPQFPVPEVSRPKPPKRNFFRRIGSALAKLFQ